MAVNKVPVLKRCRSLGLEPSYLGSVSYTHLKVFQLLSSIEAVLFTQEKLKH